MIVLDKIKQLVSSASSAINSLKRGVASIREGLDELAREEAALLSQPAPPADVEENLAGLVADLRRRWIQVHGIEVVHGASGGIERRSGAVHERAADLVVPPRPLDEILSGVVTLDMLAALCPTALLEGLRRVVQQTTYQPGPAMAARLARLAAIENERATLQHRHAELVDEAAAAGVILEHLGEEQAARFQKAHRRAAWEADGVTHRAYYARNPAARPPEPA